MLPARLFSSACLRLLAAVALLIGAASLAAPARAADGLIELAPLARVLVQGSQDEAATLATARALLAGPMRRGEPLSPAQRQEGGDRVLWVRAEIPPLADGRVWHLRLPEVRLDRITLYRLDAGGSLVLEQAGEAVPASQWAERSRMPRFRLGTAEAAPAVVVLRVAHSAPFWLDLAAVDDIRLLHDEQQAMLVLSVYFGVMGFAVVYSLLQFGFTRDRLYGLYAPYLAVMAVRQDLRSGLSRSLWLPDAPEWWMALRHLSLLAAFLLGLLLVRALLPPQLVGQRVYRVSTVAIVAALLLALAYPALPPGVAWELYNVYGLATLLLLAVMLVRAWQPGLRQLQGFALGFVVIALAALVPMLVNLSLLAPSGWSAHALLIGSIVEALILAVALSMGLSDDIAVELERRYRAPRDPATGLHGPGLLPRLVHALMLRHRRAGGQAAVIAIEVANAQDLALHHGKDAFDAMVQVTRRLLGEHARESDVALRLGRTRFALLITRSAGAHQVLGMAQRILDQGLRQAPELPASEHLRLHAVVAMLPEHVNGRGQGFVQALNAALDQIRPGSGLVLRELSPA
ncbi:MAG: 7TM diverse intracellular signaling domain-containing protein [Piscinibacter sp.]